MGASSGLATPSSRAIQPLLHMAQTALILTFSSADS
jgi:hypothetical protein